MIDQIRLIHSTVAKAGFYRLTFCSRLIYWGGGRTFCSKRNSVTVLGNNQESIPHQLEFYSSLPEC